MPGRTVEWLEVSWLASGMPLRIPVWTVQGTADGPALGVTAAIHGDELVGIEVVRRLLDRLETMPFRGTIRAIPVANPLAMEDLTRGTPLAVEIANLNRVFPGDPQGDLVARLAHRLVENFLATVDHLVDLHAGGTHAVVDYTISLHDLEAALAFGQRVVRPVDGYQGTLAAVAAGQGKTAIVAELGGGYWRDDAYVELGVRGVLNVMRHLGMLDGRPERPPEQWVVPTVVVVRPGHGGLLYSAVTLDQLGTVLAEGHVLGTVVSPYTFETLETLRAPFRRSVLLLVRVGVTRVNPGDYAFMLGDLERAEVVRHDG
ncbi:MAG: succinylglutamate desuccinylase/aspartoacylase family protein [Armatimonadota bacterium]|nr:succinylglutamate desuccinylase/aspartoacylase family protein [Armatimonadota bacterium]MDR7403936.1 succinylglutamate desuccinylase/aspartoacylase family protein [Armatimonadota bacterium]MDR7506574.1 succinylglutamate desuccinylase/aspartoacylase family protein [Armatimonadota bacterium]MDR7582046.1 succinylglutamate desuccinylase/aspartoacylase family protein [Armatimonadota bacterium]